MSWSYHLGMLSQSNGILKYWQYAYVPNIRGPWNIMNTNLQVQRKDCFNFACTPCSKRKYTLCFPVSTQNVAGAGPSGVLRDSQSECPNNKTRVCEEIPNGSKVLRESSLGCCVRKFTKICFCHWLLCYWLMKCIPSNFDSELWNHLEFFHKLSFVWCGT